MTKPARRARVDSVDRMLQIVQNVAAGPIRPPEHVQLRAEDEPFWLGVIDARSRDDWAPCDLVVAAQLARCQADIEREQKQVNEEGTVKSEEGVKSLNPRVGLIEALTRRELALLRTLRIGGFTAGPTVIAAQRRALERNAETIARRIEAEPEPEEPDRFLAN